jgi:hypothetical protein
MYSIVVAFVVVVVEDYLFGKCSPWSPPTEANKAQKLAVKH